MGAHVPRRRCVGCGRVAPKSELLRVAAVAEPSGSGARAVIDPLAQMPGRGAYLCRDERATAEHPQPAVECLEGACRRRSFARALRRPVTVDSIGCDVKLVESTSR